MFARITTFYTADPSPYWELEEGYRVRARAREKLRQMDGYEGSYFFMDRQSGKAISITLWESEEAMHGSEEATRALRKKMVGEAATIEDVGHYKVGDMVVREIHEHERVEQELEVARRIQLALLPKEVPTPEGWQISPFYQPAREVGGDFYDFLELENERLGIVVGDATGHGVPAALVMASARSMLRAVAQASDSPGDVLRRVNDVIVPDIPPNMFVTCFYAILDPQSGSLSYANAGHDLPYLRHGGDAEELRARGMPLGLISEMGYEEGEVSLREGDSVLFYSDGLVEAHDREGEMFGFPRLRALVAEHHEERQLGDVLMEELYTFVGEGWEQEDDITLLTLKRSASLRGLP